MREWKNLKDNENITWMIANAGWENSDIEEFQEIAKEIGVNLMMIDSTAELTTYINKKNGNNRYEDKVTKFAVFSHGKDTDGGTVELAYYHNNPNVLQISKDTIKNELWASAFDKPNSWFGACNLATAGKDNFAQSWKNKFGGRTWGYYGKSDYTNINSGFHPIISSSRALHGFSYYGSANYPVNGTKKINGIVSHIKEY